MQTVQAKTGAGRGLAGKQPKSKLGKKSKVQMNQVSPVERGLVTQMKQWAGYR